MEVHIPIMISDDTGFLFNTPPFTMIARRPRRVAPAADQ